LSYKGIIVRLLDRPGGRFFLAKAATLFLRCQTGEDIEIFYRHGMWTRRVNSDYFPDSPTFNYQFQDFSGWKQQIGRYVADTNEYWLHQYQPAPGDVIIDVGAGRGEDTLTFSRAVGETGRVLAVEAHPVSYGILQNFCRLNGLTNVVALHVAAMDRQGAVRIVESGTSWLENAVERVDEGSSRSVLARTLDDICKDYNIGEIAFLKMNIEGAERYALCGMQAILPRIRQICVACHDFRSDAGDGEAFRTRAFVEELLARNGFTITSRRDDVRDYVRDHVFGIRTA
jgi:FkbM family methyltransferase